MRARWVVRARVASLLAIAFVACRSEPKRRAKELPVRANCQTPEVTTCLQGYAFEELESADINRLMTEGIPRCFSKDSSRAQCSCLPLDMGHDKRVDRRVMLSCVEHGSGPPGSILYYSGKIDLNACCSAGGFPVPQAGRYGDCRPPEYWGPQPLLREWAMNVCRYRFQAK
jgi:hypothetical protein